MATGTPDLFEALERELEEIKAQREELDAREAAITRARADLELAFSGQAPPAGRAQRRPTRAGIRQKVAQHHLDAINDYLHHHGEARQADIARDLQLNSGTVSLAMKALQDAGVATPLDQKDRGSVVWKYAKTRRTTVVTAGEGVRAGRVV